MRKRKYFFLLVGHDGANPMEICFGRSLEANWKVCLFKLESSCVFSEIVEIVNA